MRAVSVLTVVALLAAPVAVASPAQGAGSPVPGRFCKTTDAGKTVSTGKYGKVKCQRKGGRYRWVDISG